jgi:hypothetical protein
MYNKKQRKKIVNNFKYLISNPPQCPCCAMESDNNQPRSGGHVSIIIGDVDIELNSIIDVKAYKKGYIHIFTSKGLYEVNEEFFKDFICCN